MDISSMFLDKLADIIEYLKNQKDFDSYAKNLLIPILIQFLKFDNFKVNSDLTSGKIKSGGIFGRNRTRAQWQG